MAFSQKYWYYKYDEVYIGNNNIVLPEKRGKGKYFFRERVACDSVQIVI